MINLQSLAIRSFSTTNFNHIISSIIQVIKCVSSDELWKMIMVKYSQWYHILQHSVIINVVHRPTGVLFGRGILVFETAGCYGPVPMHMPIRNRALSYIQSSKQDLQTAVTINSIVNQPLQHLQNIPAVLPRENSPLQSTAQHRLTTNAQNH